MDLKKKKKSIPDVFTVRAMEDAGKALVMCRHCSAIDKMRMCYQYGFNHK